MLPIEKVGVWDPEWLQAMAIVIPALVAALTSAGASIFNSRRHSKKVLSEVRQTRFEITNDHPTPLREELDARFDALAEENRYARKQINALKDSIDAYSMVQAEAIMGIRSSIDKLAERSKQEEARIRADGALLAAGLEKRLNDLEEKAE